MVQVIPYLMAASLALVVVVLLTGIVGFARNGPWYQRNANRLMNLRVAAQAVAVALLGLAIWLSG